MDIIIVNELLRTIVILIILPLVFFILGKKGIYDHSVLAGFMINIAWFCLTSVINWFIQDDVASTYLTISQVLAPTIIFTWILGVKENRKFYILIPVLYGINIGYTYLLGWNAKATSTLEGSLDIIHGIVFFGYIAILSICELNQVPIWKKSKPTNNLASSN